MVEATAQLIAHALILAILWFSNRAVVQNESKKMRAFADTVVMRLNGTANAIISSWPGPAWMKAASEERGKTVFRMAEINEKYSEMYKISRADYIGSTDLEAGWDRAKAAKFRAHDLLVWASNNPEVVREPVGGGEEVFLKLCIQTADGKRKGVLGLSLTHLLEVERNG